MNTKSLKIGYYKYNYHGRQLYLCITRIETNCHWLSVYNDEDKCWDTNTSFDHQELADDSFKPFFDATIPKCPDFKNQTCECGANKLNLPFHSDWCPLY